MKTKTIIGIIFSGFLLSMIPSISAIEYHTVINVEKIKIDIAWIPDIVIIILAYILGTILHRVFNFPPWGILKGEIA